MSLLQLALLVLIVRNYLSLISVAVAVAVSIELIGKETSMAATKTSCMQLHLYILVMQPAGQFISICVVVHPRCCTFFLANAQYSIPFWILVSYFLSSLSLLPPITFCSLEVLSPCRFLRFLQFLLFLLFLQLLLPLSDSLLYTWPGGHQLMPCQWLIGEKEKCFVQRTLPDLVSIHLLTLTQVSIEESPLTSFLFLRPQHQSFLFSPSSSYTSSYTSTSLSPHLLLLHLYLYSKRNETCYYYSINWNMFKEKF